MNSWSCQVLPITSLCSTKHAERPRLHGYTYFCDVGPIQYRILYGNILRKKKFFQFLRRIGLEMESVIWKMSRNDRTFRSWHELNNPDGADILPKCLLCDSIYLVGLVVFLSVGTGLFLGLIHIVVDLIVISHSVEAAIMAPAFNVLLIISGTISIVYIDEFFYKF